MLSKRGGVFFNTDSPHFVVISLLLCETRKEVTELYVRKTVKGRKHNWFVNFKRFW